ncbi:hypothetical protein BC351_26665 [Paenibacillus ferrarius]|uniref:Uncharacterized protein n=1 Tax=Paenibacillus ferrarius TaxID=1469647 RepID=A0A1V4HJG7_9BACL|nr:hypothetical protein [Paenibacillus ferrarius]OPH56993.1 hypothetical protein BC351_26665 [Paenibacillus ferrarius]
MVDIGFLTRWEQEHNAIQRTIEGFWNAFRIWKTQDKHGYHELFLGKLDEDFIIINVRSISLKQHYDREGAAIFCSLRLHYLHTMIGTYDMEFLLDGVTADDYLSFEDRITLHQTLATDKYALRFARKALAEGIEEDTIMKITGLEAEYISMLKRKLLN